MATFEKLKKRWAREANEQSERAKLFKKQLLEKGIPLFKKYNIKEVYLFGSLAVGRCNEHTDVDLFVTPLPPESYWPFRSKFEETVQLPIDLYTESDDHVLVQKIMKRGVKVYGL